MSNTRVNLVWLNTTAATPTWNLGDVFIIEPTPQAVYALMSAELPFTSACAWLFWDACLPLPSSRMILHAMTLPGNVWHIGLKLGMGGQPPLLSSIAPLWMFSCPLDPETHGTSWRLSLRACLIQTEVLKQMGSVNPEFLTLEGASLDMGHRYITRGVIPRHFPSLLLGHHAINSSVAIPFYDQLLFIYYHYSRWQHYWAASRAMTRYMETPWKILSTWHQVMSKQRPMEPLPFVQKHLKTPPPEFLKNARVSVLIPTLYRYAYLRVLLNQLRMQTVPPVDIVIIDQTGQDERDTTIIEEFDDLPLKIIYMDKAGQCSSRNAGIYVAKGDYILLTDDDIEILPNYIEAHLLTLYNYNADASSGFVQEIGSSKNAITSGFVQVSTVFPAGNTLVRREILYTSGLFDLAYNRLARADGDLGMRVYLSGGLMIYNPSIEVLHHHASKGGLRVHKARFITRASSRQKLMHRNLITASDIYRGYRYFSKTEVHELIFLNILATFRSEGNNIHKVAKILVGIILLPNSVMKIRQSYQYALRLLKTFPEIPTLGP